MNLVNIVILENLVILAKLVILVSGDSSNLMNLVILVIDQQDKTNRRERNTAKPYSSPTCIGSRDPRGEYGESGDSCENGNSG